MCVNKTRTGQLGGHAEIAVRFLRGTWLALPILFFWLIEHTIVFDENFIMKLVNVKSKRCKFIILERHQDMKKKEKLVAKRVFSFGVFPCKKAFWLKHCIFLSPFWVELWKVSIFSIDSPNEVISLQTPSSPTKSIPSLLTGNRPVHSDKLVNLPNGPRGLSLSLSRFLIGRRQRKGYFG